MSAPLVVAEGLVKHFALSGGFLTGAARRLVAVDGVDLTIAAGETVALVGESGSGKSTLGRLLLRLLEPTSGRVLYRGEDLTRLDEAALRRLRRRMQMVFQNPFASLNPRRSIRAVLRQPYLTHRICGADEADRRAASLLESVGLAPAARYLDRYPYELSGGQRQRVVIARAISVGPEFIVADEPVSALDMSVRAQILTLLKRLRAEMNLAYLLITHDLSVARALSTRVAVLYLGQIVESAPAERLFASPLHPYTQALIAATPIADPRRARRRERLILPGEPPSPLAPPSGCRFHTRCPHAGPECRAVAPVLREAARGHAVSCHLVHPVERPPGGTPPGPPHARGSVRWSDAGELSGGEGGSADPGPAFPSRLRSRGGGEA
ncbi:MAG TPA: ABC transporter ATP-binding protein [Thermodesulfobacteriota bacterium]